MSCVLVFPRDDANPYQRLLHGALAAEGVPTRYVAWPTRSHTVNLALLPVQLGIGRLRGGGILHLHWVYPFTLPGVPARLARRVCAAWFATCLRTARLLGLRLVWTAHNALPHSPVFADDARQRRRLVASADAVVVHAPTTLAKLDLIGAHPRLAVVAPHGPYVGIHRQLPPRGQARQCLGIGADAPLVLFFGRVARHKGVEDLVTAWRAVGQAHAGARLLVAGGCDDPALARGLRLAAQGQGGVELWLRYVPDDEVPQLFAAADLVCLPFRAITTSGSAILAAGLGRALLVPDLPELSELPRESVLRHAPGPAGLRDGLLAALSRGRSDLDRLGTAAAAAVTTTGWEASARVHARLYRSLAAIEQRKDCRVRST